MNLSRRPRRRVLVVGALLSGALAVGAASTVWPSAGAQPSHAVTSSRATSSSASSTAEDATSVSAAADSAAAAAGSIDAEAVDAAVAKLGGHVSVAVLDLDTGATYASDDDTYDTASIVKVDILAALLHQQEGKLTAAQQALATAMIERSDNAAATALFATVGGQSGLDAFNATIGLTDTVVGSDGNWGLTQTTVADQVRLLQVVLGDDSVLSAASQEYVAGLMEDVVDSQHFGVSAAADHPEDAALKVGYLQRSTTGLWDVTSIGRIEVDGHTYLVAVLSDDNASFAAGRSLVEAAAQAAFAG